MIWQIAINGFDANFSYFISNKAGEIAIVDPGNVDKLESIIHSGNLQPKMILLTHSHHDHTEGVADLVGKYRIPVYMHENAKGRVDVNEEIIVYLQDNAVIELAELQIKVLYTPGHIDDAVCYYIDGKLITGDTVFVEACGRADFPNSNVEDLYKSLQRIKQLPDETEIYPGHDYGSKPVSTIAYEKENNQYFLAQNFLEFRKLRLGF